MIFDRENDRIRPLEVEANTVIIDDYLTKPGKEGLVLFTTLIIT